MGFLRTLYELKQGPPRVVRVEKLKQRRLGPTRIEFLVFTGNESIWQMPIRTYADTVVPKGVALEPGTLLFAQERGQGTNGWKILWDRPRPTELPPMQFPNVPGGRDPLAIRQALNDMVGLGALSEQDRERGLRYLEHGWEGVL